MAFYLFVFLSLCFLLFIAENYKRFRSVAYFFFFAVLTLLSGLRGDVGQDTFSYMIIYNDLNSFGALEYYLKNKEPFTIILMFGHNYFVDNYTNLLFIVSVLQVSLLAYGTRNLSHRALFLMFYFLVFYFHDNLAALRVGVATSFVMAALSDIELSPRRSYLFFTLGLLSHVSVVILFPIFLLKRGITVFKFIKIIFLSFLLVFFIFAGFKDLILFKVYEYGLLSLSGFRVPKISLIISLVLLYSVFCVPKIRVSLVVSTVILSLILFLSGTFDIVYRMLYVSLLGVMFLCFERKAWSVGGVKPYFPAIIATLLWFSFLNIQYLYNESEKWKEISQRSVDFAYTPYNLFYQSKYRYD